MAICIMQEQLNANNKWTWKLLLQFDRLYNVNIKNANSMLRIFLVFIFHSRKL